MHDQVSVILLEIYAYTQFTVTGEPGQKSANSLAHFSVEEMRKGSSSYSSKLLESPGPLHFGKKGASTYTNHMEQLFIIKNVIYHKRTKFCSSYLNFCAPLA